MERAMIGRTKRLLIVTGMALGACTGPGTQESDLPDSAALTVPADPAATPGPVQPESVTRAPATTPTGAATPPAQRAPTQSEPVLRRPPPPRDTRPSIPLPMETLTVRRDTL